MFDAVRNNPKIVQGFLGVMTLALGSWGIDYFRSPTSQEVVARVGSTEISSNQYDYALRAKQGEMRDQMKGAVDDSVLNSPDVKTQVLQQLIDREVLTSTTRQAHIVVPDAALRDFIKARPQFQENGVFSKALYDQFIAANGTSAAVIEQQQRDAMTLYGYIGPLQQTALTPQATAKSWMTLDSEERTISELSFDGKSYVQEAKADADAVKKYYEAHKQMFQTPEQIKLEYVVLSAGELGKAAEVTEADARKWYEENIKNALTPEERRARHILVEVAKTAKPEERAAARKKAEDLLAKVKKDPSKFAELAKANSDDKVSAEQGGQLDYFEAKDVDPAFAKAAFSLKPKEISDIVESAFGYHIIMVTDIRGAQTRSFEEAKKDAFDGAKADAATHKFNDTVNGFASIVYEQRDSLKPAADKFGLKLVQTDWLARNQMSAEALQNPKLQQAIFSSEALSGHRNIEAIDIGNNTLVSARVMEYKPAVVRPFQEVADRVATYVKGEESIKLAQSKGAEALAKLTGGAAVTGLAWKPARTVKRSDVALDGAARKQIFAAKGDKFPMYVGAEQDQGYVIYRLDSVSAGKAPTEAAKIKDFQGRYAQVLGDEDRRALVSALRQRLGVKILQSVDKQSD